MFINHKFWGFLKSFKMLDEHITYVDYSDVPWFDCKERILLNVPQALTGNTPPFNCFVHSEECLASCIWKINLTNKYRLSNGILEGFGPAEAVGLHLLTPVSVKEKVEWRCKGKTGLLFFTSEVCSLQASFPLQMQQQKGALPLLPSPYMHPPTPTPELQPCTATLDSFSISYSSLHSIHFLLTNQAALLERTNADFNKMWILYTQIHTGHSRCCLSQDREAFVLPSLGAFIRCPWEKQKILGGEDGSSQECLKWEGYSILHSWLARVDTRGSRCVPCTRVWRRSRVPRKMCLLWGHVR